MPGGSVTSRELQSVLFGPYTRPVSGVCLSARDMSIELNFQFTSSSFSASTSLKRRPHSRASSTAQRKDMFSSAARRRSRSTACSSSSTFSFRLRTFGRSTLSIGLRARYSHCTAFPNMLDSVS